MTDRRAAGTEGHPAARAHASTIESPAAGVNDGHEPLRFGILENARFHAVAAPSTGGSRGPPSGGETSTPYYAETRGGVAEPAVSRRECTRYNAKGKMQKAKCLGKEAVVSDFELTCRTGVSPATRLLSPCSSRLCPHLGRRHPTNGMGRGFATDGIRDREGNLHPPDQRLGRRATGFDEQARRLHGMASEI